MYDFKRNIPTSQLLAGSPKYVLINIARDKRQDKGKHAWAPGAWTWNITRWLPPSSVYQSELQVQPKPKVGGREQSSPLDNKSNFTWQRAQVQEGIRNVWKCLLLSHVWLFAIPQTAAHQASLSFTISQSLLKLMSIESVMPSSHLILCCPLLLLPIIFPSIKVFSNELALLNRWPKYWSFSFNRRGLIAGVTGPKFVFFLNHRKLVIINY